MEEKYVALFQNPEVWSDYKRTCFPVLDPAGSNAMKSRVACSTATPSSTPTRTRRASPIRTHGTAGEIPTIRRHARRSWTHRGVAAGGWCAGGHPHQQDMTHALHPRYRIDATPRRLSFLGALEAGISPQGLKVLAELTDQGTADFGTLLGSGIGEVEGVVTSASDSTLTLAVSLVRQRSGIEHTWKGERVLIPRRSIATLREQRVSRGRTTLAAAASATGLALVTVVFGYCLLGGGSIIGSGGGRGK